MQEGRLGRVPELVGHLVLLHVALQAESFVSQLGGRTGQLLYSMYSLLYRYQ